jgi:hypothetical protein
MVISYTTLTPPGLRIAASSSSMSEELLTGGRGVAAGAAFGC